MAERIIKKMRKALKRGRVRKLSLASRVFLYFLGKRDGKNEAIKCDADGKWTSAFVITRLNGFNERADCIWGDLQTITIEDLRRLRTINDELETMREEYENSFLSSDKPSIELKRPILMRKRGEESLPDSIVISRRWKERSHLLFEAKELRNKITENINAAKLACERIAMHTEMEINYYWGKALKFSSQREMPISPNVSVRNRAEDTFLKYHELLIQTADIALNKI